MSVILVTGAGGLLGPYLLEEARRHDRVVASTLRSGSHPCDLTDRAAVKTLADDVAPTHVIHTAAYTDVDGCERDPQKADALNRLAVANLAAALPPSARLVQVSTDQVYPDTAGLHREGHEGPVNTYGRSKLAGEKAALEREGSVVLRVNFFGPSRTEGRRSLSDFVVDNLRAKKPITLFEDVLFSPLHVATLAALLVEIAKSSVATGVYNLGCREGSSKADFGLAVARHSGLSTDTVTIGSSSAVAMRAPRPRDLRMEVSRIETALGRPMPSLAHEIARLPHGEPTAA
jgi:dTDP-4-dehydrorhamnose reductase